MTATLRRPRRDAAAVTIAAMRRAAAARDNYVSWQQRRREGIARGWNLRPNQLTLTIPIEGPIGHVDEVGKGVFAADVARRLAANDHVTTIRLRVDSPGGLITEANQIFNLLRSRSKNANIVAIAKGWVASAAIDIFLGADVRQAQENARFLVHSTAISAPRSSERLTAKALQRLSQKMSECDAKTVQRLAERTGTSVACWNRIMSEPDKEFDVAAAKRFGIVNCEMGAECEINGRMYFWPIGS